eukprot:2490823-Prymnesium_polylepis.2
MMVEDADYIDTSVRVLLRDGNIRLLSCAWLQELGPSAQPLSRRQDLPPQAFLSSDEAVEAHDFGRVYVLSYGWVTAAHPDPDAHTLRRVVAFLCSAWLTGKNAMPAVGLFWDWASLPQKDPACFDTAETIETKAEGAERAAFLADLEAKRKFCGGSAYEHSRTAMDRDIFERALSAMGNLYGSMWCTT